MNTIEDGLSPVGGAARAVTPHPTHRFKLLLQREFWEHKGGFLWAPLIAGAISLVLTLMFLLVAEAAASRHARHLNLNLHNGNSISINGLDLGALTEHLGPSDIQRLADGIDLSLLIASCWPFIVMTFVVFFYCLGALYDERKDRSVLFWKSLPISDRDTVLSKVASATLIAPAIATAAAIVTMFGFLIMISFIVLAHGGNPVKLLWGPGSPLTLAGHLIAAIPVYALWAMPTVGWLLLCSAWARSKPFLWAIMLPVFAGVIVFWFDIMQFFNLESSWFWQHVVARLLFSVAPVTWLGVAHWQAMDAHPAEAHTPDAIRELFSLPTMYSTLATPQLWIGVLAGAAMILIAIRLRRWRDEG